MHKLVWNGVLSDEPSGIQVADFDLEYSVSGDKESLRLVRDELLKTGRFCNFQMQSRKFGSSFFKTKPGFYENDDEPK